MITNGDRFVMDGLDCSFRTPNSDQSPKGRIIHMGHEVRKQAPKGTICSRELILLFAQTVETTYQCTIVTDIHASGFVFVFTQVPSKHILAEYEKIIITRECINAMLRETNPPVEPITTFENYFSPAVLDVFRWFLDALSGKKHTVHVTRDEVRWEPPPKPTRYTTQFPKSTSGRDEDPPTRRNPMKK